MILLNNVKERNPNPNPKIFIIYSFFGMNPNILIVVFLKIRSYATTLPQRRE